MVQLSSPTVEMIPVQKGPSPEKNNAPKSGEKDFKTAFNEQKEIHEAREAEKNTESGSTEQQKTAPSRSERTEQSNAADSSKEGEASETDSSDSLASDKETDVKDKSSALNFLKSNTQKKALKLTAGNTEESGKKGKSVALDKNSASLMAAAQQKAVPGSEDTLQSVQAGSDSESEADAEATLTAASSDDLRDALSSDLKSMNDLSAQAVRTASSLVQQNESGKEEGKDGKSRLQRSNEKKSSELKITVDDRRSVKEAAPVLQEVERDTSSNKLTLEFVPSDDVSTAMPQGEQADTGRTFSLMSAEEQKGAALLDRQLQDKGTQELTKNIRFVLKDNKEGEIKLILKPEALGKVRINLNLSENNIVGKIIVENNSVRQAFMNNLSELTKALEDSGFGSASLDVSVGGGQTEGGAQYRDEKPVYFTSNAIDDMDGQIPVIYEDGVNLSQINLVV